MDLQIESCVFHKPPFLAVWFYTAKLWLKPTLVIKELDYFVGGKSWGVLGKGPLDPTPKSATEINLILFVQLLVSWHGKPL